MRDRFLPSLGSLRALQNEAEEIAGKAEKTAELAALDKSIEEQRQNAPGT